MSPEPSFTQSLREEGFIQGSDVVSKANDAKDEVVTNIEEEVTQVEETVKTETETKATQAKSFADDTAKSASSDSFIGKIVDAIKNIF